MNKILMALATLVMLSPMMAGATTLEEHEKLLKEQDKNYIAYLRGLAQGANLANLVSMTQTNNYLFCPYDDWNKNEAWNEKLVNLVVKAYGKEYQGAPVETIFVLSLPKMFHCESQKVFQGEQ